MKKIFVLCLAFVLVMSFVGCSQENESDTFNVIEFNGKHFNTEDLSKETLEWLEWYNSLSPEDQLAVSSVPTDLYDYDNSGTVDAIANE